MLEIYLFFLLGSASAGYFLLRLGSPKMQAIELNKKIYYGYAVGAAVFGIPAVIGLLTGDKILYFIVMVFGCTAGTMLMFVKRNLEGNLQEPEEMAAKARKPKATQRPAVAFEQGLMVKQKKDEETASAKQGLLGKLKESTRAAEAEDIEKKKREALERLRKSAVQIKKAKEKKSEESDEIEEELLSGIAEGDEVPTEEEY